MTTLIDHSTDTDRETIRDALVAAVAARSQARQELDEAEDNVRALVERAADNGLEWNELEGITGMSHLILSHRYQSAVGGH